MMEWISVHEKKPLNVWQCVFVTDGEITCLARWIDDPKNWYGEDLLDDESEEEIQLDKEWHLPHWKFETDIGPFSGNHECFGIIGEITHWMNLPIPLTKP